MPTVSLSVSETVPPVGGPDVGLLELNPDIPTPNYAPIDVQFEPVLSTDPQLRTLSDGDVGNSLYGDYDQEAHELIWEWSLGDAGNYSTLTRLPSHMRSRNVGHGKRPTRVYDTPGEKTVTCVIYKPVFSNGQLTFELIARKTVTFVVGDIDAAIPMANRLYLSTSPQDADFPGGGATFQQVSNPISTSNGPHITWLQGGDNRAVFFKAGEDFQFGAGQGFAGNTYKDRFLGRYGTGANPVIRPDPTISRTWSGGAAAWINHGYDVIDTFDGAGRVVYDRLAFRSHWNSIDENWAGGVEGNLVPMDIFQAGRYLINRCSADGIGQNMIGAGNWLPDLGRPEQPGDLARIGRRYMTINETTATNWWNYGLITCGSPRDRVSLLGVKAELHSDAASNMLHGYGTIGGTTQRMNHGPVRICGHRIYVAQCELHSRAGWFSNTQPCGRFMYKEWVPYRAEIPYTPHTMIWGNLFEGGDRIINSEFAGETIPEQYNAIIKNNFLVANWNTYNLMTWTGGSLSIAENYFIRPDVGHVLGSFEDITTGPIRQPNICEELYLGEPGLGYAAADNTAPNSRRYPLRVYGNTLVDLRSNVLPGGSDTPTWTIAAFTGLVEEYDNVYWRPSLAPTNIGDGPMETAQNITPQSTRGPSVQLTTDPTVIPTIYDTATNTGKNFGTAVDGLPILRPQAGSGAAGAATGTLGRLDIMGRPRPTNAARGAVEPT